MAVTVELMAEEETQLRAKTERQGQEPEGVVHGLVRQGLSAPVLTVPLADAPVSDEAHEALIRRLLATGLMAERPTRPLGPPPIIALGRPVSEIIVEERR